MKLLTAAFLALFASSAVAQSTVPACAQTCIKTVPPMSSDCDDSDPTDVFDKCICSELTPDNPVIKCAKSTCSSSDLAAFASTYPSLCRAQLFGNAGGAQTSTSSGTSGKTGTSSTGASTPASSPTSSPASTTGGAKTSSAASSQTSASTTSSSKGAAANQALPTLAAIAGAFAGAVFVGI
ncbi:hypothetical protein NQ176_g6152 [Zarea fungicola]|uniref:Uncharacterized protein n=1 Tax=Zarea fungicola TaxID=93591 RepID=A0ACC1N633_9HYPO|nr:hypothetical protein NQ176_g6152 [Lecanicillium fungicola]